ncbi:MAG: nucleotidyltransferase substrate binding protein [Treponema sp.]|jgi:hypothetical protein|nr:nucleotidyltransferase substrate binding protein [Treponema sp.]
MTTQIDPDIRWRQRFSNYVKAFDKLCEEAEYLRVHAGELAPILADLAKEGLVRSFEFTHALAWNVMKDYAAWQSAAVVNDITAVYIPLFVRFKKVMEGKQAVCAAD